MKKVIVLSLALLIALSASQEVFAQNAYPSPTKTQKTVTPSPATEEVMEKDVMEKEETASPPAKIEYTLAYPGILPDNPLYFLKAIRDRLVSFLINDPLKRAEFNLLTSDKRIAAARLLADRGKDDLAISTLSKSNNYLHSAISSINDAARAGKKYDTVLHNLKLAVKKHEEVILEIGKLVDKKFYNQLQAEQTRLTELGKSADKISLK